MKKKFLSIFLAILIFMSSFSTAYADDLSKKKNQLKDIKSSISSIKKKISVIQGEKKETLVAMDKLDKEIDIAEGEISRLKNQVKKTNESITSTTEELNRSIEEFREYKNQCSERIKAIYMNGPSGYLEILLSSESFSDFLSRAENVNIIMKYDNQLLTEMKEKQKNIEEKKKLLVDKKKQLEKCKREYALKKDKLDDANKRKKQFYVKLNSDQKELEDALEEELRMSRQLEKQIKDILIARQKNSNIYSGDKTGILRVSDIGYMPKITSQFGMRYHPILHKYKMHTGVDFGVPSGTPVYSMADGEVIISQYLSGYGYTVVIDHGSGITTLYAHNSRLLVSDGQKVKKGQRVSISGSTGYSTGPHLHFEVRRNGTPIDPNPYIIIGK